MSDNKRKKGKQMTANPNQPPMSAELIAELLVKITPTPPWRTVVSDFYDGGHRFIVWGPDGVGHGTVCRTFREGLIPSETETMRAEANAAFIAASPQIARYALQLLEQLAAFERKEYICQRCWLRHDPPRKEEVEF